MTLFSLDSIIGRLILKLSYGKSILLNTAYSLQHARVYCDHLREMLTVGCLKYMPASCIALSMRNYFACAPAFAIVYHYVLDVMIIIIIIARAYLQSFGTYQYCRCYWNIIRSSTITCVILQTPCTCIDHVCSLMI